MRRRKNIPYISLVVIALLFGLMGFALGTLRNNSNIEKPEITYEEIDKDKPINNEMEPNGKHEAPVVNREILVNPSTKIIFRTLYTSCQSIRDNIMEPLKDMIGLKEEGFKNYIAEKFGQWQIVRFSLEEIILFRRLDQICPDHYFVSEEDGFIAIYQFNEEGEKMLIEKTSLPISILPNIDQDKLKRGILLRNREEVNRLLEDYSG